MKKIFLAIVFLVSIFANGQGNSSRNAEVGSTALSRLIQVMVNTKAAKTTQSESPLVTVLIGRKFCLLVNKKDTIVLQETSIPDLPASDIKMFKAKNASLYCISWTEKLHASDSLKTEDITTHCSVICDLKKKTPVMSNFYKTTFTSEIVFLSNTQASETREKTRKEGLEFALEADGSITLKSSTQQERMVYDENLGKFIYAGN